MSIKALQIVSSFGCFDYNDFFAIFLSHKCLVFSSFNGWKIAKTGEKLQKTRQIVQFGRFLTANSEPPVTLIFEPSLSKILQFCRASLP